MLCMPRQRKTWRNTMPWRQNDRVMQHHTYKHPLTSHISFPPHSVVCGCVSVFWVGVCVNVCGVCVYVSGCVCVLRVLLWVSGAVYICKHIHIHIYFHICIYIYMYIYTYIDISIHMCIYILWSFRGSVCGFVYLNSYILINTYICIQIHMHIYLYV